jgi:alkanesulfonate monooxygenase SsuD/methylene tetrahydromethanopterin reductase-like flavin-dependent oxidoreductase (luciferase family)
MLAITLPYVDWWNSWYSWYGNTPEGFGELNARLDAAAERAGRDLNKVARSTTVLVELEEDAVQRPHSDEGVPAVSLDGLRAHLGALSDAGADEAILILRPIDEVSIRAVGAVLAE